MPTFNLILDTDKQSIVPQQVRARQGDGDSVIVRAEVTEDGAAYSFAGKSVRFECTKPDGHIARDPNVEVSGSTLIYAIPKEVISAPGTIRAAYFRILQGDTFIDSTESFIIFVDKGIGDVSADSIGDYLGDVDRSLAALKQQQAAAGEAEAQRQSNESGRIAAEGGRVAAEEERDADEALRVYAENNRAGAEGRRDAAEARRMASEGEREAAEEDRAIAELGREEAEAYRRATFAEIEQRSRGWLRYYCIEGEWDAATRRPAIAEPDAGTLYFVPEENPTDDGHWVEWMWDAPNSRWESLGTTTASVTPISADQLDAIAAGTDADEGGNEVLTRWGLRYWLVKLKSIFAPLIHAHSAADITSGTLSAARIADKSIAAAKIADRAVGKDQLSEAVWDSISLESYRTRIADRVTDLDTHREGLATFDDKAQHSPLQGRYGLCLCFNYADTWLWQIALLTDNAKMYTRRSINGGAWTDWVAD